MLLGSLGLFAVAALFGLFMATRIFAGKLAPWGAAIPHGLLAASGLGLLVFAILSGPQATPIWVAGALLTIAALGGFALAAIHVRGAVAPKALVAVHALAAVGGVVVLAASALNLFPA